MKNIEAELDAQVARVESAVRERARKDHDEEKRELQSKMGMEMAQLQSQLKIFQKVRLALHDNTSYTRNYFLPDFRKHC